jgi:hydrogenase/urease accessory protein HupE
VSSIRRCCAFVGVVFFFLLVGTATASAHVIDSTGYSTIQQNGQEVSYVLSLEYDILTKAVDLGPQATSAVDDDQREEALESGTEQLEQYLDDRVIVSLDGAACEPALQGSSIGKRGQKSYADLELLFSCPGSSGSYRLQYTVFAESEAVADDHTNVVQYRFGDKSGRTVFNQSHHEVAIGHSTALGSSAQFGQMGVKHILLGLDHVLFVVALILGAANFHGLLKVISMFTVAHSVTLIATLLGGITVPAVIVEPLIALSIAFVAVENLLGPTRRRLAVVFGFGLLHGLGFAGSLRITDEVSWDLLVSLLSFNVGIETGQAMLLVAVFPLVLLVRRSRLSVPIIRAATGVVAAFGLFWFVERFLLA